MGMPRERWGVARSSGLTSGLVGEEYHDVQVVVELELDLEVELGLPVAAPLGVTEGVHKSFVKPVHRPWVHKSVHIKLMTAASVL